MILLEMNTTPNFIGNNVILVIWTVFVLMPFISCAQLSENELDSIDGFYIPKDLDEAFHEINSMLSDSARVEVAARSEDEFVEESHFGLGLWMRNNWKLWGDSQCANYFKRKDVSHPDDMSRIILTSYHRQITGKPIALKKQIKEYRKNWKKSEREDARYMRQDFKAFEVYDTVYFRFYDGFISDHQKELYKTEACEAKGVVLDSDKAGFEILIKLIESCDSEGVIIAKDEISEQQTTFTHERFEVLKVGEEKWMHYTQWRPEKLIF